MPKLSDFFSRETPWNCKLSDFLNGVLVMTALEPITTNIGPAYLMTAQLEDDENPPAEPYRVLCGGQVVVKALDAVHAADAQNADVFPMRVKVIKTRGRDFSYFEIVDPDDADD